MKILIVEDESRLAQFVREALTGQHHTVTLVGSCREAREAMRVAAYDAVVLDLTLPDGDGLNLLREWRLSGSSAPVLILSARDSVADRVTGLDLGADDYLPKPFSLEELLARMRSLLRRQSAVKRTVLEHTDMKLDLLARMLLVNGSEVELTSREFALLEVFMHNPGRVLPRTLICEKIWDSANDIDTNLLDVYMSKLRAKLETTLGRPVFKTVRGVGYRLL